MKFAEKILRALITGKIDFAQMFVNLNGEGRINATTKNEYVLFAEMNLKQINIKRQNVVQESVRHFCGMGDKK